MSKIKDEKIASSGLDGLFKRVQSNTQEKLLQTIEDEETQELLKMRLKKKQYSKVGRPRAGEERGENKYIRMTFMVKEEKLKKLRAISERQTRFIKDVLEDGMDKVIAEFEAENGKIKV